MVAYLPSKVKCTTADRYNIYPGPVEDDKQLLWVSMGGREGYSHLVGNSGSDCCVAPLTWTTTLAMTGYERVAQDDEEGRDHVLRVHITQEHSFCQTRFPKSFHCVLIDSTVFKAKSPRSSNMHLSLP